MISLAVSAMFAGCSQEEVASAPQPDGKNALSVNVTTQDFVDESGNGSRATTNDDANRTTVFVANDDAMGVYAFSADGTQTPTQDAARNTLLCNYYVEKDLGDGSEAYQ